MGIHTPEAFTTFGCLDTLAFDDGKPFGAHLLRTIALDSNRLALRGDHWFTLLWPVADTSASADYDMMSSLMDRWVAITPPMTLPKKPGVNRADIRIRARITNTVKAYFQIATRARPFDPFVDKANDPNVLTATSAATSFASYTKDSIHVDEGHFETVQIFVHGAQAFEALASTGTFGTPNDAQADLVTGDSIIYAGSTWTSVIDDGRVTIWFTDSSGDILATPRLVNGKGQPNAGDYERLYFTPALSDEELERVRAVGRHFELHAIEQIAIASIALATRTRSF